MPVNKQLLFCVFRLSWETILQYLPHIILWYYINHTVGLSFFSYTLPTITLRLEHC